MQFQILTSRKRSKAIIAAIEGVIEVLPGQRYYFLFCRILSDPYQKLAKFVTAEDDSLLGGEN